MSRPIPAPTTPVLLVGCGRLGSAMVNGWLGTGALDGAGLMIRTPSSRPAVERARDAGAAINPDDDALKQARTVVLAVKPALWRQVAAELSPLLAADAVIVSVMAGVVSSDISQAFAGRATARVMPTTGVALGRGAASIHAADPAAAAAAHALFDPIAATVELTDEGMIDAATGVSGSGQAYVYAFVEALARAGTAAGLAPAEAAALARATLESGAAMLTADPRPPAELIAEVASPGGTTEAALRVLARPGGLDDLLRAAVQAAVDRAAELAES